MNRHTKEERRSAFPASSSSLLLNAKHLESGDRPRVLQCDGVERWVRRRSLPSGDQSPSRRSGALVSRNHTATTHSFLFGRMNEKDCKSVSFLESNVQVIWLILAELMCFFQRFSHACVSRALIKRNCERLITTDIIYLFFSI